MPGPPSAISLLAIIEAIEGDSRRQTCVLRGGPCSAGGVCAVHAAFFAAQDALSGGAGRRHAGRRRPAPARLPPPVEQQAAGA